MRTEHGLRPRQSEILESESVPQGMFYLVNYIDGDRYLLCEGSITELGDAFSAWGMIMDHLGHDAKVDLIFNRDDIKENSEIIFTDR